MLADTLQRSFARPDLEVVIAVDSGPPISADVAVVTGDLPAGVVAEIVVRIPDPTGLAEGSITTSSGREPAVLGDLTAVVEALDRLLAD